MTKTNQYTKALAVVAAGALALCLLALVAVRPAGAAFPGTNGKIAYNGIETINPDGTAWTDLDNGGQEPSWTANGGKISFQILVPGSGPGDIYTMNADGSNQTLVGKGFNPAFSPDGKKIAFKSCAASGDFPCDSDKNDISVMNADGSGRQSLTGNLTNHSVGSMEKSPAFSPDGKKIAFVSNANAGEASEPSIWVMNADGSGQTRLTSPTLGQDFNPDWSPDGTKIVFSRITSSTMGSELYVMNADGSNLHKVPNTLTGGSDIKPSWSPDGKRIVYHSFQGGTTYAQIYTISPDGSGLKSLNRTGYHPDWQPVPSKGSCSIGLAAKPATLTYGKATTLSGKLTTSAGTALSGKKVILKQRPVGAATFSRVPGQPASGLTTSSTGFFRLDGVKPAKNTDYRATFAGDAGYESCASTLERVNVKAIVHLKLSTTSVKLGKGVTISGSVQPSHTGSVKLKIKRNGVKVAEKIVTLNDSKYRFVYKPAKTGSYSAVASFAGDKDHLGNLSPTKSFKATR